MDLKVVSRGVSLCSEFRKTIRHAATLAFSADSRRVRSVLVVVSDDRQAVDRPSGRIVCRVRAELDDDRIVVEHTSHAKFMAVARALARTGRAVGKHLGREPGAGHAIAG